MMLTGQILAQAVGKAWVQTASNEWGRGFLAFPPTVAAILLTGKLFDSGEVVPQG
jgi:hypothetical protein